MSIHYIDLTNSQILFNLENLYILGLNHRSDIHTHSAYQLTKDSILFNCRKKFNSVMVSLAWLKCVPTKDLELYRH